MAMTPAERQAAKRERNRENEIQLDLLRSQQKSAAAILERAMAIIELVESGEKNLSMLGTARGHIEAAKILIDTDSKAKMESEKMEKFSIWKDGKKDEAIIIDANDMPNALDKAAVHFGFIDYADMAQEENWSGNEGLNIEVSHA